MTDAMIEAVMLMVLVFLGMRVLYGSWPWEGHKTWYATRRSLLPVERDEEGISLSPEQIAHAVASATSNTNGQPETTKISEKSGINGNPAHQKQRRRRRRNGVTVADPPSQASDVSACSLSPAVEPQKGETDGDLSVRLGRLHHATSV